jgi:hypothetical protein
VAVEGEGERQLNFAIKLIAFGAGITWAGGLFDAKKAPAGAFFYAKTRRIESG